MKGIAGFLAISVVLALAGGVALGVGAFERNMAAADESLATLRYADAEEQLDAAEEYARYARLIPGSGGRAQQDTKPEPSHVFPPFRSLRCGHTAAGPC